MDAINAAIEAATGSSSLDQFRIVRQLDFYEEIDEKTGKLLQKMKLVLDSENLNPNYRVTFVFSEISGLRLEGFGGGETRILGFAIDRISLRQWEGLNWQVSDFEGGAIELFCKSAEVTSIASIS